MTPSASSDQDRQGDSVLVVEHHGAVRVLTLNRPDKRNALNTTLLRALERELCRADQQASVRAIVMAGRGTSFSAGGDRVEFLHSTNARLAMAERARLMGEILTLIPELSVPVVSAVRGAALGGGAALALAADMTIAGDDLRLGYPELGDGVIPAVVMPGAVHLFGRRLAFELLSTQRRLSAEEASRYGAVNLVVPADSVVTAAVMLAEKWAAAEPTAMAESKRLFQRVVDLPVKEGIAAGVDVTAATWTPRHQGAGSTGGDT